VPDEKLLLAGVAALGVAGAKVGRASGAYSHRPCAAGRRAGAGAKRVGPGGAPGACRPPQKGHKAFTQSPPAPRAPACRCRR
jgi:hypothetical protein